MSEGEPTPELLAIRFGTSENAQTFKDKFEEAQKSNAEAFKSS
jgi:Ran-binding protein 1